MPLVTKSIPNLINGVSQQPAALRLASQAETVINCIPSSVEGLKKRPPFYHQARMFTGTAGTTRPFSSIVDRDGAVQYLIYITDGDLKVFSLAGVILASLIFVEPSKPVVAEVDVSTLSFVIAPF